MVGAGVLLGHAEEVEFGLEGVAATLAAGESGGEHHVVVGQGGGRNAMLSDGGAEGGEHDRPGHSRVGGDRQRIAGVVVEPGQDLGIGAALGGW